MRRTLIFVGLLLAANAVAETSEPTAANPGEPVAAEIARTPEAVPATEAAPPVEAAVAPVLVPTPAPVAEPAKPATTVVAEAPRLDGKITASLHVGARGTSAFLLDDRGTELSPSPIEERLRVAPEVRYGGWAFLGEFDAASGVVSGQPSSELVAERMPTPNFRAIDLRQAYVEYKGATWVARGGQMASSWGLGMVANPGNKDAPVGDFGDANFGDIAWRALIAGRPFYAWGGLWRALEPAIGADLVVRDDTADFFEGDRALQGVLALRLAQDADHFLGVYTVLRRQRAVGVSDGGRATDAFVFDVAGKWTLGAPDMLEASVGFEVVSITGTSTQTRSELAPVSKVDQFGAAVKTSFWSGDFQLYIDGGFASGDQNPYDDKLEGFRFDPDYNVGMVLFDQVLGWQSARTGLRAADPSLVGVAPEGVQLVPTRGALTGAWYLFPRARYGVQEWLDVYGGPLFAFTSAKLVDPYTTRLGGGTALNSLGGSPGNYLGTELDLGVQGRFKPNKSTLINATVEGGYLLPGSAFAQPGGGSLAPVFSGRLRLGITI